MVAAAGTTTILFTDLVSSTELMQQAGDERAQRIFQAHYRLLRDAVAANGGQEVKTLGDGLMVAFASAADAVRTAIEMQQAARTRTAGGERLEFRVGLNSGDALRDEGDFFGTPVVIAWRLCDAAEPGHIICSNVVAGLLAGRQAFAFRDLGPLTLKGISEPVAASEVLFSDEPGALLTHTPFIGRSAEMTRLQEKLNAAKAGRGGLVMLVGEPGIGKTRLAEEFGAWARDGGPLVLWGRCFEGEYQPPYAPFAQAIGQYAGTASPEELRADLGYGGPPVARLAPEVLRALPDLPEPEPLQPDEERFRLLDAVSQLLIAASRRTPLVLVLDDLHWADRGTIAMLRHVARFAKQNRMLLVGSYRDVELDRQHPLSDALSALRREAEYERILLRGLDIDEVGSLLETIAEHDVNQELVEAISAQTEGNPFFIREVLMHLVEEGKLFYEDGRWRSKATTIADLGIPEGVRQVIGRRLSRLSPDANSLLQAAAAFNSVFRFEVVSELADLQEKRALDALDEALEAQLLRPAGDSESFDFTHALVRQTLYTELSPPRQVRLHRGAAEAIEHVFGDRTADWAADLAYQYHQSSVLPGADRGVDYALAAADRAQSRYAWEEVVGLLRMAVDVLAEGDTRRSRILGRLGIALAWSREPEESVRIAGEATELIGASEGGSAAADYAWEAMLALEEAGFQRAAWTLADAGMNHIGDRRDHVWAALRGVQLNGLEGRNPDGPGIPLLTPARAEVEEVLKGLPAGVRIPSGIVTFGASRTRPDGPVIWMTSESAIKSREAEAERFEARGRLAPALLGWSNAARSYVARGDIAAAREVLLRAQALAQRLPGAASAVTTLNSVYDELALATDSGYEAMVATIDRFLATDSPENVWLLAPIRAAGMRAHARIGDKVEALRLLETLIAPLELAPGGAPNYTRLACDVATGLWWLGSTDHLDVVERSIREKVVEPDFRYPMQDGRLSLARLCALAGRYDEAREWFAKARDYLDERGARPLRAITDLDEGWMYLRWPRAGDRRAARPLLEAALAQFNDIGMTGWVTRAEELLSSSALPDKRQAPEYPEGLSEREVDVLRLIAAARTNQQIADELVISLNTVERHVNHILTKTGAANRVELALFAQRSGLLG